MTDPAPPLDDADAVRLLLAEAGLHPPEDDLRTLGNLYGEVRRQLGELWAVEVGEDPPATSFRAATVDGPAEGR